MTGKIEWTLEDSGRAYREGWEIFNIGTMNLRIERLDEEEIFESDDEAWQFISEQILAGSEFHAKALLFVLQENPQEFLSFSFLTGLQVFESTSTGELVPAFRAKVEEKKASQSLLRLNLQTHPELEELLKKASAHEMTPAEKRAQRLSWVAGELGIEHPDWSPEYCREMALQAIGEGGDQLTEHEKRALVLANAAGKATVTPRSETIICLWFDTPADATAFTTALRNYKENK